jgi:hypothetical protein
MSLLFWDILRGSAVKRTCIKLAVDRSITYLLTELSPS